MGFARGITEMSKALISMVRREIGRARNTGGVRLGLPKVTIDAAHIEMLCNLVEQAASAQDDGKAVAWLWVKHGAKTPVPKDFADELIADGECVLSLYTHPPSAVVPKWVSVKEDLPKSSDGLWSDPVIALADSGHAFTLSCMGSSWQRTYAFIADGATCVTHWMLFPEPPKQDTLN
jgi:hypothetical protein